MKSFSLESLFKEMYFKMASQKCGPFLSGFNMTIIISKKCLQNINQNIWF